MRSFYLNGHYLRVNPILQCLLLSPRHYQYRNINIEATMNHCNGSDIPYCFDIFYQSYTHLFPLNMYEYATWIKFQPLAMIYVQLVSLVDSFAARLQARINTLKPRQNDRYLEDNILEIFLSIEIIFWFKFRWSLFLRVQFTSPTR